jgi:hypothetical protein
LTVGTRPVRVNGLPLDPGKVTFTAEIAEDAED